MSKDLLYVPAMADKILPGPEWFKTLRKLSGLTQEKFGALIGVTAQAVSNWERGGLPDLANYLALADKLIDLANATGNNELLLTTLAFKRITPTEIPADDQWQTARAVPLISKVTAGLWGDAADPYPVGMAENFVSVDRDYGAGTFALTIDGESMLPRFEPGDVVIIDPEVTALPGDYVVAKTTDENAATFKKIRFVRQQGPLQAVELVPLNDDWPVLRLDAEHDGRIVGVMVEHRSFRHR